MSTEERIKSIIQEVLNVDIIEITNSAHLIHDLGASKFQLSEIINRIETAYSTILGFESFDMTVEDLLIVVLSEIKDNRPKLHNKPRPLHYAFVHKVIPHLVFNEGVNLFWDLRFKKGHDYMDDSLALLKLDEMKRPIKQGLDYLNELWDSLAKELDSDYMDTKGLDYDILEKSNRLFILFHFPEPEAVGEAYYSLFAWNQNAPTNEAVHYFTLELSNNDKAVIGEWKADGVHTTYGSYNQVFTPRQFLDEVLKNLLPHENKSIIDANKDVSSAPEFLVEGYTEKEHIYIKIVLAIAHKLNLPASQINQKTSVQSLVKQDYIDIIYEVYSMYGIDPKKHHLFIKQDVDRLIKTSGEQAINCSTMLLKICQHFENRIAGDYDNPKELYLDYRAKIDLISQSPDFKILYNFISATYPSFITDNANQKLIENKELLYQEILTISDIHLDHNYPVDPRGLFICLVAISISYVNLTHSNEKAISFMKSATALNTKWGPYIKPALLERVIHKRASDRLLDRFASFWTSKS